MNIHLNEQHEGLLQQLTVSGNFTSPEETIGEALRLLEKESAKQRWLDEALEEGEQSGESDQTPEQILAEIKAECYGK